MAETITSAGGSLEALYYTFGERDVLIVADLPDDAAATAISLTIGATGALEMSVVVLVTPETVDEALRRSVTYRPPGA